MDLETPSTLSAKCLILVFFQLVKQFDRIFFKAKYFQKAQLFYKVRLSAYRL